MRLPALKPMLLRQHSFMQDSSDKRNTLNRLVKDHMTAAFHSPNLRQQVTVPSAESWVLSQTFTFGNKLVDVDTSLADAPPFLS